MEFPMIRTVYLSALSILACTALTFSLSVSFGLDAGPLMIAGIITGLVVALVNIVTNIMNPVIRSDQEIK
jgi:uncharacterized membrane protein